MIPSCTAKMQSSQQNLSELYYILGYKASLGQLQEKAHPNKMAFLRNQKGHFITKMYCYIFN